MEFKFRLSWVNITEFLRSIYQSSVKTLSTRLLTGLSFRTFVGYENPLRTFFSFDHNLHFVAAFDIHRAICKT